MLYSISTGEGGSHQHPEQKQYAGLILKLRKSASHRITPRPHRQRAGARGSVGYAHMREDMRILGRLAPVRIRPRAPVRIRAMQVAACRPSES